MDIVADVLIRIKNGYLASKKEVLVPYSKLIVSILKLLSKEGYLENFEEIQDARNEKIKRIMVFMKYSSENSVVQKNAAITDVKRISKPGLRVYKNNKSLPFVLNGLGIAIISTPKGIMTDKQARKIGVGGEVLAYVW